TKSLKSVDLNGKDERTHITSKYANRLVPSPDGQWIAFTNLHKAYVAPFVMTGKPIDLDDNSKTVPVTQITKDAGMNLHSSDNSHNSHGTPGDKYFTNRVSEKFTFLPTSPYAMSRVTETG